MKLPREKTGYPCYTCLWEIEKQPIPDISPYPDKKKGSNETFTLRDVLTGEHLCVLPLHAKTALKNVSREDSTIIKT